MSRCPPSAQQPTAHVASNRTPWSMPQCSDSRSSTNSSHSYHRIVPVAAPFVPVDECRYWDGGGSHQGTSTTMLPGYVSGSNQIAATTAVAIPIYQPQSLQQQQPPPPPPRFIDSPLRQTPPSHNFHSTSDSGTGRRSCIPSPTEAAIVPCGGHCVVLETFCHHFLQVAFVAGILTGMCLVVAGLVFGVRTGPGGLPPIRARGPDLSVLTYIGSLTSLVSALLLSVQCCGRQRGGSRLTQKSTMRTQQQQQQPLTTTNTLREEIPMRELPPLQPLLTEIVHQQIRHHNHLREESGIPWWRREDISN